MWRLCEITPSTLAEPTQVAIAGTAQHSATAAAARTPALAFHAPDVPLAKLRAWTWRLGHTLSELDWQQAVAMTATHTMKKEH